MDIGAFNSLVAEVEKELVHRQEYVIASLASASLEFFRSQAAYIEALKQVLSQAQSIRKKASQGEE
jgi:hypothetical protein